MPRTIMETENYILTEQWSWHFQKSSLQRQQGSVWHHYAEADTTLVPEQPPPRAAWCQSHPTSTIRCIKHSPQHRYYLGKIWHRQRTASAIRNTAVTLFVSDILGLMSGWQQQCDRVKYVDGF